MADTITSVQNPAVQRLRALKAKKGRRESGLFLVEGEKLISEALDAGLAARDALIERDCAESLGVLANRLRSAGARVMFVTRHVLEAASDTVTPSGALAAFEPPVALDLTNPPRLLVALDGLQDPGNVGSIWRTADAAGFGGLILGEGCPDPLSPKVVRSAMGSAFRLPAAESIALGDQLGALRQAGYRVVVTALDGDDIYQRPDIGERFVVVIGSEARGVSADAGAQADARLKLPMRGGAESLNAAVAAGIIMYELTRGM